MCIDNDCSDNISLLISLIRCSLFVLLYSLRNTFNAHVVVAVWGVVFSMPATTVIELRVRWKNYFDRSCSSRSFFFISTWRLIVILLTKIVSVTQTKKNNFLHHYIKDLCTLCIWLSCARKHTKNIIIFQWNEATWWKE